MLVDRAKLSKDLARDEGIILVAYDDATGKPIKPGEKYKGKLTIGIGRNLDGNPLKPSELAIIGHDCRSRPITMQEAFLLLGNDIDDTIRVVRSTFDWADGLDEVRARALVNLVFNMGIFTMLKFKHFLAAMKIGAWTRAAEELKDSAWHNQVGARALRIEFMIALGRDA